MKRILAVLLALSIAAPALAQQLILKGATVYKCQFTVVDSTDHFTGKTGRTITFTINKDGGSFAAKHEGTAISEISTGTYVALLDATDTNTDGLIGYKATATATDPADGFCGQVVEFDPRGATPTSATVAAAVMDEALSGHTTAGTAGKAISDIDAHTDTEIASILAATVARSGTAQAGGASTITLDSGASASDNFYAGAIVILTSGTGAGQIRTILSYVGSTKVATVSRPWVTNPSSSSVFSLVTP